MRSSIAYPQHPIHERFQCACSLFFALSIGAMTPLQGPCSGRGVRRRVAKTSLYSSRRLDTTPNCCFHCVNLSCLVLSCLVLSCLVLSCLVLSCLVLSCLVLSCLVLSCLVLSCLVLSCLVLSCLVLSCLVLSCLVLSCLVLSCLVLSCLLCATCPNSDAGGSCPVVPKTKWTKKSDLLGNPSNPSLQCDAVDISTTAPKPRRWRHLQAFASTRRQRRRQQVVLGELRRHAIRHRDQRRTGDSGVGGSCHMRPELSQAGRALSTALEWAVWSAVLPGLCRRAEVLQATRGSALSAVRSVRAHKLACSSSARRGPLGHLAVPWRANREWTDAVGESCLRDVDKKAQRHGLRFVGCPYPELARSITGVGRILGVKLTSLQMRHSGASIDSAKGVRTLDQIRQRGRWITDKSVRR